MYQINQQPPQRIDRRLDGTLTVHSTFHTIQGEGPFAGQSAFFIRLAGCNLQCPGCDTIYTGQNFFYTPTALRDLVYREGRLPPELIVITGGEPFRQNITPAVGLLAIAGFRVQIETNGVLHLAGFPYGHENVTVVCSPKTAKIHPLTAERVDAYKYVMEEGKVADDGLPTTALAHELGGNAEHVARPPFGWQGPIYLQPMDVKDEVQNQRNAVACAESVMRCRSYILGTQMHKFLELP